MAKNETITATASFTTAGRKISYRGTTLTINDTSNNDVVIVIDRNWKTSAASSYYGGFYIKPALDMAAEVISRFGNFDTSKRYIFVIANDVAIIGNTQFSPAVTDGNWGYGVTSPIIENYGLVFGRGGSNGLGGGLKGRMSYYLPRVEPTYGGTAFYSNRVSYIVNNYGGISSGGGGGGVCTEYSQYSVVGTDATEYNSVMLPSIISGAGAPFGNTTRDNNVMNDVCLMKLHIPWFGRSNGFNSNEINSPYDSELNWSQMVYVRNDYQNNKITICDTNFNNTRTFDVINKPNWWVDRTNAGLGTAINYLFNYKQNYTKNYRPPYNGDPANQGGYLDTVMPAGLFRGGRGGNPEVNLMSDLYVVRFIPCMTEAASQIWRDRWRGANGGDIGRGGSNGVNTPLYTMRYWPKQNPKGYQYLDGAQGYAYKVGNLADVYYYGTNTGGAASGSTVAGSVAIYNLNGGVLGADAVLNRYDPNGTFDINARAAAGNSTLNFPLIY